MNARVARPGTSAAVFAAAVFFSAATSPSGAAGECSLDTFAIAGSAVKITICPAPVKTGPAGAASVALTETIESAGTSFSRSSELDFFDGSTTSRSIDDVPLARIGIAKTLHVTIGYKAGVVHVEHALLVPGAIALK